MKRKLLYIFIISFLVLTSACEKIFIGPQPKFIKEQEVPVALNIFGILRTDSLYDQPASFITISIIAPTVNDTIDNWFVDDASVFIKNSNEQYIYDTATFLYDTNLRGKVQYLNYNFNPIALNTYYIECYKPGYDTVYANTTIPSKAEVVDHHYEHGDLSITLRNKPDTYLFQVYIYSYLYESVLVKHEQEFTNMEIHTGELPPYIEIFTYDKNLAKYYSTINVFIKPNTYREPFSTVENGYGCFGSLNKCTLYMEK